MSDRDARIVAMARAGMKLREIAAEVGLTRARCGQIVSSSLGPRSRPRPFTAAEDATLAELAALGWTTGQIVRALDRSWSGVSARCLKLGLRLAPDPETVASRGRAKQRRAAVRRVSRGATFNAAAAATGLTRNAVAGASWRAKRRAEAQKQ